MSFWAIELSRKDKEYKDSTEMYKINIPLERLNILDLPDLMLQIFGLVNEILRSIFFEEKYGKSSADLSAAIILPDGTLIKADKDNVPIYHVEPSKSRAWQVKKLESPIKYDGIPMLSYAEKICKDGDYIIMIVGDETPAVKARDLTQHLNELAAVNEISSSELVLLPLPPLDALAQGLATRLSSLCKDSLNIITYQHSAIQSTKRVEALKMIEAKTPPSTLLMVAKGHGEFGHIFAQLAPQLFHEIFSHRLSLEIPIHKIRNFKEFSQRFYNYFETISFQLAEEGPIPALTEKIDTLLMSLANEVHPIIPILDSNECLMNTTMLETELARLEIGKTLAEIMRQFHRWSIIHDFVTKKANDAGMIDDKKVYEFMSKQVRIQFIPNEIDQWLVEIERFIRTLENTNSTVFASIACSAGSTEIEKSRTLYDEFNEQVLQKITQPTSSDDTIETNPAGP